MRTIDHIHFHGQWASVTGLDVLGDEWDPTGAEVEVTAEIGLHSEDMFGPAFWDDECSGDHLSLQGVWRVVDRAWKEFRLTHHCVCDRVLPHAQAHGIEWRDTADAHRAEVVVRADLLAERLVWLLPPGVSESAQAWIWRTLSAEFIEMVGKWNAENLPGTPWAAVFAIDLPVLPEPNRVPT